VFRQETALFMAAALSNAGCNLMFRVSEPAVIRQRYTLTIWKTRADKPLLTERSAMATTIYITALDRRRLELLADTLAGKEYMDRYASMLMDVLDSAEVVTSEEIPTDVVTMNSRVRYADMTAHSTKEITLVYPEEADAAKARSQSFRRSAMPCWA